MYVFIRINYMMSEGSIPLPYPFNAHRGDLIPLSEFLQEPGGKLVGKIVDGQLYISWDLISYDFEMKKFEVVYFSFAGTDRAEYFDDIEAAIQSLRFTYIVDESQVTELAAIHQQLANAGVDEELLSGIAGDVGEI